MINTQFIYRVAPTSEGKTDWLAECIYRELQKQADQTAPRVVVFTRMASKYAEIAKNYHAKTGEIFACPLVTDPAAVRSGDVVCIEDLQTDAISGQDFIQLSGVASKVYVTIQGEISTDELTPYIDFDQLTMTELI